MLSLAAPTLATSALAQSLKPVTIECTTNGKALSVSENNPNAAEAHCEFTCYYVAADKQQHHTATAQAIVLPGKHTSDRGRVDGEPPYSNVSTKGSCTSWKCQNTSTGALQCNDH
jgi:hypothetical protein